MKEAQIYTRADALHRLSALQLLGINPLQAYKNLDTEFELFVPDIAQNYLTKQNLNSGDFSSKPAVSKNNLVKKQNLNQLFTDLNLASSDNKIEQKPRSKEVFNENTKTFPSLNLHIWSFSNKFLVLSDCKFNSNNELNEAEKLLTNIFNALRMGWSLLGHYEFNMPDRRMPSAILQNMDWDSMANLLQTYLTGARFATMQPLNGVILFSDNNLQQIRQVLADNFNLYLAAPSLTTLLNKPSQKQILWQKILHENWHKKLDITQ